MKVKSNTSAKSIHHAADQALEHLDLIRGILNLSINIQQSFRMTWGGKPKPVNLIIPGPLHTLHKPNGQLIAKNNWWYEPSYLGSIKTFSPNPDEIKILEQNLHKVKLKLKSHKYSSDIKKAIIRYTRALDERDWITSFLKIMGDFRISY